MNSFVYSAMKKLYLLLILILSSTLTYAQWGVEFIASNLSQLSVNYEINERIRPGVAIGTDTYFEDISIEVTGTYDILDRSEFEVYVGAGARFNYFSGVVIPVGVNVYPFETARLGFKIEIAPIIGDESVLRGGAGLRIRIP